MLAEDVGLAGRLALDSFRQLAAVGCDEGTARQVIAALKPIPLSRSIAFSR